MTKTAAIAALLVGWPNLHQQFLSPDTLEGLNKMKEIKM
jgi:hypothetical protein